MPDHVDHILELWRVERPDLDLSAMAVIARIQRSSRLLEQEIETLLAGFDLNLPAFGVLTALLRSGPPYRMTPTALYDSLLVTSGAMTNRLDRLTDAGLVERIPAPSDRRSMLVALTDTGRELTDSAISAHTDQELNLLAPLAASDRRALVGALRKLLEALEAKPPGDGEPPTES
jgi:DNA-binding MarR family transcriptional regulator